MLGYTLVNIIFKNSPVQLGLTFKGYKRAEEAMKLVHIGAPEMLSLEDDFGCKALLDLLTVAGVVLNDVDKEIARGVEVRIENDLVLNKRIEAERQKPENRIMMPAGSPIVANA